MTKQERTTLKLKLNSTLRAIFATTGDNYPALTDKQWKSMEYDRARRNDPVKWAERQEQQRQATARCRARRQEAAAAKRAKLVL